MNQHPTDGGRETIVTAVTAHHRAQCDAMVAGDTGALDALLADGFTLTHMTGYLQSKDEWLDEIDRGSMRYHSIEDIRIDVDVDGDTPVLTARTLTDATIWGSQNTWCLQLQTRFKADGAVGWTAARTLASTW